MYGDVESHFPYDEYRPYQREILTEAAEAINDGVDVIIIDAPTGIGKSGINMTLAEWVGDAFYTTPQKHLRDQLTDDKKLAPMHTALKARADYSCDVPLTEHPITSWDIDVDAFDWFKNRSWDCENCLINKDDDESCRDFAAPPGSTKSWCGYWEQKERAMDSDVAAFTFMYLIRDSNIESHQKTWCGKNDQRKLEQKMIQKSFTDRELLIVDEAQSIEGQVSSLILTQTVSENTLNINIPDFFDESDDIKREWHGNFDLGGLNKIFALETKFKDGDTEQMSTDDALDVLNEVRQNASDRSNYIDEVIETLDDDDDRLVKLYDLKEKFKSIHQGIRDLHERFKNIDTKWVVNTEVSPTKFKFQPVRVDDFLREKVWQRPNTIILSSATIPYQSNIDKWLNRIGLDTDTNTVKKISKPSPFAKKNRLVVTGHMVGHLRSGGKDVYEEEIAKKIRHIYTDLHNGENGLIHTVSYDWAERLHEHLDDIAILHKNNDDRESKDIISDWQSDERDILLSPSMMQGVDLKGDMCRWQALAKVPWPYLGDARVEYLNENEPMWYDNTTAMKIMQSVGRAVRSSDDSATYYALDEDFDDVDTDRYPEWFQKSIVEKRPYSAL
jgi:Rad3-related DNA helicase